jgi:hypothetical protein
MRRVAAMGIEPFLRVGKWLIRILSAVVLGAT